MFLEDVFLSLGRSFQILKVTAARPSHPCLKPAEVVISGNRLMEGALISITLLTLLLLPFPRLKKKGGSEEEMERGDNAEL